MKNNFRATLISILMIFISYFFSKNIITHMITLLPGIVLDKLLNIFYENQSTINLTVFLILSFVFYCSFKIVYIKRTFKELIIFNFLMLFLVNSLGFYFSSLLSNIYNDGQSIYSYNLYTTIFLFLLEGIVLDCTHRKNRNRSV